LKIGPAGRGGGGDEKCLQIVVQTIWRMVNREVLSRLSGRAATARLMNPGAGPGVRGQGRGGGSMRGWAGQEVEPWGWTGPEIELGSGRPIG